MIIKGEDNGLSHRHTAQATEHEIFVLANQRCVYILISISESLNQTGLGLFQHNPYSK